MPLPQNMNPEELGVFRTRKCPRKSAECTCELDERCPFSHCLSWHRRNPNAFPYRPNLCPDVNFSMVAGKMRVYNQCRSGRLCMYSHTKEEQMYHPLVYKTVLCRNWQCCSKAYCPFAHGTKEVRKLNSEMSEWVQGQLRFSGGDTLNHNRRRQRGELETGSDGVSFPAAQPLIPMNGRSNQEVWNSISSCSSTIASTASSHSSGSHPSPFPQRTNSAKTIVFLLANALTDKVNNTSQKLRVVGEEDLNSDLAGNGRSEERLLLSKLPVWLHPALCTDPAWRHDDDRFSRMLRAESFSTTDDISRQSCQEESTELPEEPKKDYLIHMVTPCKQLMENTKCDLRALKRSSYGEHCCKLDPPFLPQFDKHCIQRVYQCSDSGEAREPSQVTEIGAAAVEEIIRLLHGAALN